MPYLRYGETVEGVVAAIEAVRGRLEAGLSRDDLQTLMPHGAARCAVDCALWDLEAKETGMPIWQRADLPRPKPLETAFTLSLDTPEVMAKTARQADEGLLKLKLGRDGGLERVAAVHAARPDARLILDANEGLTPDALPKLMNEAHKLGVVLIEQPLPAGGDDTLADWSGPVPVCADESVHTSADMDRIARTYGAVNIKLDKAGGLTEGLAMVKAARTAGLKVMVGCMVAGSLSMAPALLLAGLADFVDLDGPLWLAEDVADGLRYEAGIVQPPTPALWG